MSRKEKWALTGAVVLFVVSAVIPRINRPQATGKGQLASVIQSRQTATKSMIAGTDDSSLMQNDVVPGSFIVELSNDPLSKTYSHLKGLKANAASIKITIAQQRLALINQQDAVIVSLPASVKNKNTLNKIRRYSNVLNGFALTMNPSEVAQVKKMQGVKRIVAIEKVHADLMDSVPLINAPQVWAGAVGGASIAGKGITIAIIDTGVDYTHPDLGGCYGSGC